MPRLLALSVLLLAVAVGGAIAGCASDPSASDLVDTEADRLLAAVTADALAPAFERAARYRADLTVSVFDAHVVVGRETATIVVDGDSVQIADHSATGVLEGAEPGALRLRDPVAPSVPQDPPYLDPSVREAYRISVLGDTTIAGARFRRVEAVLIDEARELGIRRVWAAVDADGRIGAVEIDRQSGSVLYDEASRARVDLAPGPGGWVPRRVTTDTRTDVPLSDPAHVRTVWTVREVDGQPVRRGG